MTSLSYSYPTFLSMLSTPHARFPSTPEPSQVYPHDYKRVLAEIAEAKAQGIDWDEDEEGKSMVAV